jgi:hypothetical protein
MRKRSEIIIPAVAILVCLGALLLEAQTNVVRRAIDELVYDNRNHYLPCKKLPTEDKVRRIVKENAETIRRIEQVNPGLVGVEVENSTCPGKADLLIGRRKDRLAIEAIISAGTFHGVPYRLQNR